MSNRAKAQQSALQKDEKVPMTGRVVAGLDSTPMFGTAVSRPLVLSQPIFIKI